MIAVPQFGGGLSHGGNGQQNISKAQSSTRSTLHLLVHDID
jgi:hypothetical protein